MYVYMYACMCVYRYVGMYVCTYVCIYLLKDIRPRKLICLYHGYRNMPYDCTHRVHIILNSSDSLNSKKINKFNKH